MAPYTVVTILLVCVLLAVKAHSAPKGKGGRPKPPPWKYGGSSGKYGGGSREYGGGNRDYAGGREGENVFAKLFDYSIYTGWFICNVGNMRGSVIAIPGRKVCDGKIDCSDGCDETGCNICAPGQIKCNTGSNCAIPCDGNAECVGGEDERGCKKRWNACNCKQGHYSCKGQAKCVPVEMICDGAKDCPHNDDEIGCPASCECPAGQYRCLGGAKCVLADQFCNGVDDCPHGDDERGCADSCVCQSGQYKCLFGDCIDRKHLCDGKKQCVLGEDDFSREGQLCYSLACEAEAPLVDGTPPVPDDHMTASSECGPIFCWPYLARLNFTGGTWCSSNLDLEPYIQVRFLETSVVTSVAIQGAIRGPGWTTVYKLEFSIDCVTFQPLLGSDGQIQEFAGNVDPGSIVTNPLPAPMEALCVRLLPLEWDGKEDGKRVCLHFEMYGCAA